MMRASGMLFAMLMIEVAAVPRRVIEGLLKGGSGTIVPDPIKRAFGNKHDLDTAIGKLKKRITDPGATVPIGHNTIRAYLGDGKPDRASRGERQRTRIAKSAVPVVDVRHAGVGYDPQLRRFAASAAPACGPTWREQ
jgi:hypothetical protein